MHVDTSNVSILFIVIGTLLLLGLATDFLGRKSRLPRVTLLFLFGFLLGPGAIGVLPEISQGWFPLISNFALLLVGFLMGGKLTEKSIRENGVVVLLISVSVVLATILIVTTGLILLSIPISIALLLAGIATATDPAATIDVIDETQAKGQFTDTLQSIVSVDDAWGLIAFSILLAIVHLIEGSVGSMSIILTAAWELFGAIGLGILLGLPMAYISGRIKPGQPTLVEALGIVLLCGGLAQMLHVSFLLSAMTLGVVVTNFAKHHEQPFHEIEDIEWPFMILFFVFTGASLELAMLSKVIVLTVGYIAFRTLARLVGCWPGAVLAKASPEIKNWMGLTLLPQAGVATGMALIAASQFPQYAESIIPVVVVATIIFELIGPICTRVALQRVKETNLPAD